MEVGAIQYGTMSPSMILDQSVVHVSKEDSSLQGTAVLHSLLDPRMGPCDNRTRCQTCHQTRQLCPGHFGHALLARPLFNIGFMGHVVRILKRVCWHCSLLLVHRHTADFASYVANAGYRNIQTCSRVLAQCAVKKRRCQVQARDPASGQAVVLGCGRAQPQLKLSNGYYIEVTHSTESARDTEGRLPALMRAADALRILSGISNEDAVLLGCSPDSRPEWMITTVLPIPPYCTRPNTALAGAKTESCDDLTYKLSEIIKHNNRVKKLIETRKSETEIDGQLELLQYHYATYLDNDISGVPPSVQRMGQPIKGIRQRLQRKEGRFRKNLNGKRGNFTARSVISPDPNLKIDEVAIPAAIAAHLSCDERVFGLNLQRLQQTVWRGPDQRNGANFVVYPATATREAITINLAHTHPTSVTIEPGCIVKRHLADGDYVLFNRQPSLHKNSMLSHRVRVMPNRTFRLNLSATTPYNADFVCVLALFLALRFARLLFVYLCARTATR